MDPRKVNFRQFWYKNLNLAEWFLLKPIYCSFSLKQFIVKSNCGTNKKKEEEQQEQQLLLFLDVSRLTDGGTRQNDDQQTEKLSRKIWWDNLRPVSQAMFIFVRANTAQNDQRFTVILSYITAG